jgi:hypothetical protein
MMILAAGNNWNFTGTGRKEREASQKSMKKSEDFSAGILLPCSADFQCFPAGAGPYFLTWGVLRQSPIWLTSKKRIG